MGWTLEQLRSLSEEDYEELYAWALERGKKSDDDESIDADEIVRRLDDKKRSEADAGYDI